MALFTIQQEYAPPEGEEQNSPLTFRDWAKNDIDNVFFRTGEHAEWHQVDGKEMLVIPAEGEVKEHNARWEAGSKRDFDSGLYKSRSVIYLRKSDYGEKPKVGKLLVMDSGSDRQRTYSILQCREEGGVYRMTLERIRQ